MKWINKGHELDAMASKLESLYRKKKNIYLYGAGERSKKSLLLLTRKFKINGFIDRDYSKFENGYLGKKVISFETYLKECEPEQDLIIICASEKNTQEIQESLELANLKHQENFLTAKELEEEYYPIIAAYFYDECFVPLAQIVLTNRCTLSCASCAHGCQIKQNDSDLTIEKVFESVDVFFEKVDYVLEFSLLGGEPLLYPGLDKCIDYVGKHYRNRMGVFNITTNGTLLLSKEVAEACRQYNVTINISDYSKAVKNLDERIVKLERMLKEYNILYSRFIADEWVDYGFNKIVHSDSENEMIDFFDSCKTPCREIRGSDYFYCVSSRVSGQSYGWKEYETDCLDFRKLEKDYKKVILEYNLGYSEQGYLSMCRRCNGSFRHNPYKIPVAIQQ